MNSTVRFLRPIFLGAFVVALVSAGGCHWFKAKSTYANSPENRPLEVPPELDLPDTSAATVLPPVSGSVNAPSSVATDITLAGTANEVYSKVGSILEGIEGVAIQGRAEALNSFDVTYQGQSFLVRLEDVNGGCRLMALSASGQFLTSGPAAQLLTAIRSKL